MLALQELKTKKLRTKGKKATRPVSCRLAPRFSRDPWLRTNPFFACQAMGCSSGKFSRQETTDRRPDVFIPPAPKANINEVNANGSHVISDELDETAKKKKLLRQKHQMSMEDRHNQVLLLLLSSSPRSWWTPLFRVFLVVFQNRTCCCYHSTYGKTCVESCHNVPQVYVKLRMKMMRLWTEI